jgi:murein DD-endopeptidase MepM/ murein hydrolase activator NlpD
VKGILKKQKGEKIMSIPRGVYTFESVAFEGKMLNLYYNTSVANGQNVVLYTRDGSEEQKWKLIGDRLVSMRNESFALDRYHTSNTSNQNNNNADVWAIADTDSADQIVQVRMISDNIAVIVLNDNKMVLKAVSSANGTNSGKTVQSSGNVYWSEPTENYDDTQKWYITRVDVEDETEKPQTEGQKLVLPIKQCKLNASYKNEAYQNTYSYIHYGVDLGSTAHTSSGDTIRTVYASGNGVVIAKGWDEKAGYVTVIKYPNAYHKTTQTYKDVIFRYYHFNSLNSSLSVGDWVTADTVLGEYGGSGMGSLNYWTGKHLHVEADTDTEHPCYSPTFGRSGGIIIGTWGGANDSTMSSPLTWLYIGEGMSYTTAGDQYINSGDETLRSI